MELKIQRLNKTGLYYRPDTQDLSMMEEIFIEKIYKKNFPFKKKSTIIDIGAQNGYFSIFSSRNLDNNSKIFAFEPNIDNYNILKKNISLNQINNITQNNLAVSKDGKPIRIFYNTHHTGGDSIYMERIQVYQQRHIKSYVSKSVSFISTVPTYVNEIDFCKIDVEGAEFDILLNTPKIFLKKIKNYAIEFHEYSGNDVRSMATLFDNLGYKVEYYYSPSKRGVMFGMFYATKI